MGSEHQEESIEDAGGVVLEELQARVSGTHATEEDSAVFKQQVDPAVILEIQQLEIQEGENEQVLEPTVLLESQRHSDEETAPVQPTIILDSQPETSQGDDDREHKEAQQNGHSFLKLEKQPEAVELSTKYVLEWGIKQDRATLKESELASKTAGSIVAENIIGETSDPAGYIDTTPLSQRLSNVTALCSNNKKAPSLAKVVDVDSPLKLESTLDRVRKVLFEDNKLVRQDVIVGMVQTDLVKNPSTDMSYLNSQEPGEESQANAMDALDRLVSICGDFSQDPQVNEFQVEAVERTPNLQLHIAQLPGKESASVYDFMPSQEALPFSEETEKAGQVNDAEQREELAIIPASDKDVDCQHDNERAIVSKDGTNEEQARDELAIVPVVESQRKTRRKTPKSAAKDVAKRRSSTSPPEQPVRGKRRKSSHEVALAATPATPAAADETAKRKPARATRRKGSIGVVPKASPVTPENGLELQVNKTYNTRSSTLKRKALSEQLILAEDTPRRCRRKQIKVLFSHSLDSSTIEQQKKTIKKLHFQIAESASECTHFVTDRFLRTANMLEVLAAGKPVVTIAWLESSGIAGCGVDEKKFLLEDFKREREYGFSMRSTYTAAQQKLLLEGMKVFVTPGAKRDLVERIVLAAGGTVVRAYDDSDENCLVISCDENRKSCSPLIRKGVRIYSTEFLFSSIVSYHLDFSQNILFAE